MRKRIQDEYKDLYILHGCVFLVTYTCCFCILVFFLHRTGIKIIIIFKNNNDIFNSYSSSPNGLWVNIVLVKSNYLVKNIETKQL